MRSWMLFLTVVIRIQPGRPDDVVKAIGKAVLDAIIESLKPAGQMQVSVSVDVQLINRDASFSARLPLAETA